MPAPPSPPPENEVFNFIKHQALPGKGDARYTQPDHWMDYLYNPEKLERLFEKYHTQILTGKAGVRREPSFSFSPWTLALGLLQKCKEKILVEKTSPAMPDQNDSKRIEMRKLAMFIAAYFRFSLQEMHTNLQPEHSQVIIDEFLKISGTYDETINLTNFLTIQRTSGTTPKPDSSARATTPAIEHNDDGIFLSIVLHRRWELSMLIEDMMPTRPPGATVPVGSTAAQNNQTSSPEETDRIKMVTDIRSKQPEQQSLKYLEKAVHEVESCKPNGILFPLFVPDSLKNKSDSKLSPSKNPNDKLPSLNLTCSELIAQVSLDLARYYFLDEKLDEARTYFDICLQKLNKYNTEDWIGYFEELGPFAPKTNTIESVKKYINSQLDVCNSILDVHDNLQSTIQMPDMDGLVNRAMMFLTSQRLGSLFDLLINDTYFQKIPQTFRAFIEVQVARPSIASKICMANLVSRIATIEADAELHELAREFLRRFPQLERMHEFKDVLVSVVSSMNKHFDASKDGALSMSAPSFKNKKVFDGKLKVVVTYLLEHTDPMYANVLNSAKPLMSELYTTGECVRFDDQLFQKWKITQGQLADPVDVLEELPLDTRAARSRILTSSNKTSPLVLKRDVMDVDIDTSAASRSQNDASSLEDGEEEGELDDGSSEDRTAPQRHVSGDGLEGLETADLAYLPFGYRILLHKLNNPKITYQIVKAIKLQYAQNYSRSKQILTELQRQSGSKTRLVGVSRSNDTSALPIPILKIISNEILISDLLAYGDDSTSSMAVAAHNSSLPPEATARQASVLVVGGASGGLLEGQHQPLDHVTMVRQTKNFINSMVRYGVCSAYDGSIASTPRNTQKTDDLMNEENLTSSMSLQNNNLVLLDRRIFPRCLAYLIDRRALDTIHGDDYQSLGSLHRTRHGILLQLASAIQNVLTKTEESNSHRKKAVAWLTDVITTMVAVKVHDDLNSFRTTSAATTEQELHGFNVMDFVEFATLGKENDLPTFVASALIKVYRCRKDIPAQLTTIHKYEKIFTKFSGLNTYTMKLDVGSLEKSIQRLLKLFINKTLGGQPRLPQVRNDIAIKISKETDAQVKVDKGSRKGQKRGAQRTVYSVSADGGVVLQHASVSQDDDFCLLVHDTKKLAAVLPFVRALAELQYTSRRYYPAVRSFLRLLCLGTNYFNDRGILISTFFNDNLVSKLIKSFHKIGYENIAVLLAQCLTRPEYSLASKIDTPIFLTSWWRYVWDPYLLEILAQNASERADVSTFEYLRSVMDTIPIYKESTPIAINTDKFLDMCKCLYYTL